MHKQLHEIGSALGLDCGDNSCLCAAQKGGMRTNGGCRCDFAQAVRALREELERERLRLAVCARVAHIGDVEALSPEYESAALASIRALRATIARVEALPEQWRQEEALRHPEDCPALSGGDCAHNLEAALRQP